MGDNAQNNEPLLDTEVVKVYNNKAILHPNMNAVLDAGTSARSLRSNILHDFFSKKIVTAFMPKNAEFTLLDFGTGVGRMSKFLSPFYKNIIGVDVSENMLKIANENKQMNIENHLLTNHVLPINENSVDIVFSYWVFASISNAELAKIFPEIYRVMKPNSQIYFYEQTMSQSQYDFNVHKKRTIEEYTELLTDAGFEFVRSEKLLRMPSYAMAWWCRFRFIPKLFLPIFGAIEKYTIKRKPEHIEYYTCGFEFIKK
jgi:ubiquinone/menaquinone biosynthesis C-methylase UbiE